MNKLTKLFLIGFISMFLLSGICIYIIVANNKNFSIEKSKINNELDSTKIELSNFQSLSAIKTKYIDSLTKVNTLLSKYRSLTDAMSYRDSIRKPLVNLHEIGDIVIMKSDSARVLVKDILTGGGQFNHYIVYLIKRKDNSTEMVSPEEIFSK